MNLVGEDSNILFIILYISLYPQVNIFIKHLVRNFTGGSNNMYVVLFNKLLSCSQKVMHETIVVSDHLHSVYCSAFDVSYC